MVSIQATRAANNSIASQIPTAVFTGATSGIGLGAIEALLKSTTSSKVYIIGRSQANFAPTLAKLQLQDLNPSAQLVFIEAQVSQLKEVEHARIVSILAAGEEGAVNTTDVGLSDPKNYGFFAAMRQGVTMMSLVMRELSLENPNVSFIHTNPGMVSTAVHHKWAETMTGYLTPLSWLLKWGLIPMMYLFGRTAEEAGQVGLYELTNERYSASSGNNLFRLLENAENASASSILLKYIEDGTQRKVWEHTMGLYEKVLVQ
ncbi:Oxidoreductase lepF [Lachnellula arida]|uniref:Oxidoreductase lepF n=1 Tax=Lachnellula arida TaxID=1316785 RepID=A0A8T9BLC6_9HELO|nr:Oxidoreductase lepF [Lachnellula arida]